ncbi:hypothetical protein GIB67_032947 [Kingdonia uniflora]|uniref:Snakin-2 n=1 Tax=Kingdonia uniflora TaxID=39325 RepID=A0A7J7MY99_9MAGN|nr:hypothetical protein GIB67_032947 [Kingdonia uniflora]
MAFMIRVILVILVLLFCLSKVSTAEGEMERITQDIDIVRGGNRRLLLAINCNALCAVRCSANSRPNLCKRACGTCCWRCKCVPPGTYGNHQVCGSCYANMKTRGNKPKCP